MGVFPKIGLSPVLYPIGINLQEHELMIFHKNKMAFLCKKRTVLVCSTV